MLGIPNDIVDATENLLLAADDWRPRRVDLGSVNGRHFLFSSGYGLDAAVVRQVDAHPATKARLRHWYFAWAGIRTFTRDYLRNALQIDVEAGGETVRGVTVLAQTGDPYTYWGDLPLHVAEGARLDDGTLAGVVLCRAAPPDAPTIIARLFSKRLRIVDHRRVHGWSGERAVRCVSADGRAIPLQVDGDYIGDAAEAHYEVLPGALTVVS
jgi:diacylglycerol kinase family enzyme